MVLYKATATLKKEIEKIRQLGKTIGFAPTMGALHQGHISLIDASKNKCEITICSIFVNPSQFNDPEDFKKYPSTIGNDILLLENAGCNILFLPAVDEIYPSGIKPGTPYDLGDLEYILEGKYRPGHFQGVCQVVHRLLDIVNPDYLFLGEKDYQQCIIIKRLIGLINSQTKIITVSTLREDTGLAMSSRNLRLTEEQKKSATGISKMLYYITTHYLDTPSPRLEKYATDYVLSIGFDSVDYVSIADAETLHPVNDITKTGRLIALIAAFIGGIRLIDNIIFHE